MENELQHIEMHYLIFTRKRKPLSTEYILKGATLENTDSSTYLGVTIQKDLKWGEHINKITTKTTGN